MRRNGRSTTVLALFVALALMGVTAVHAAPAAVAAAPTSVKEKVTSSATGPGERKLRIVTEDPSGVTGTVTMSVRDGEIGAIAVRGAAKDGTKGSDVFQLVTLRQDAPGRVATRLKSQKTGQLVELDPAKAQQQVAPILVILGVLASRGLVIALQRFGSTAVQNAARSHLLNGINAQKWGHIMNPKHNWSTVGGTSRERIADLMAMAMTHGRHQLSPGGGAKEAHFAYGGKTIVVRYNKETGQIGNGWVP